VEERRSTLFASSATAIQLSKALFMGLAGARLRGGVGASFIEDRGLVMDEGWCRKGKPRRLYI